MKKEIYRKLKNIVGEDNFTAVREECFCYGYDGSGQGYTPDVVVFPNTAQQVRAIMLLANQYSFPVVPRGAGSGMTGGSLPVEGGVVVATSRMNRIVEIDTVNMICVVEPGVITGVLQEKLRKYGLMYPPDPASLKFCTLGGNAAECAGGPSAVKYGVTRDYIIGLEVVLPTGEILKTGVRTEKSVVGYDLTHLFIGSEGTLGIFTKLILRLLPLPEAKATFSITADSLSRITELVAEILQKGFLPCTLEYLDRTSLDVVASHLSAPLPPNTAALLLVEFDGDSGEVERQAGKFCDFLVERPLRFQRATSASEVATLWQARRLVSPATFSLKPQKISEDVVVPRSRIPPLVSFTEQLASELGLTILTFGHAGDGNIHVNIMVDKSDVSEYQRARQARERLFRFVLELGGSLSGEHGIGTTKSEFLPLELDDNSLALMKRLKHFFDPANILNPGKIFPGSSCDQIDFR